MSTTDDLVDADAIPDSPGPLMALAIRARGNMLYAYIGQPDMSDARLIGSIRAAVAADEAVFKAFVDTMQKACCVVAHEVFGASIARFEETDAPDWTPPDELKQH